MASEPKRGCGYRKVGGKYLVGGGVGMPCDRLPMELNVCPCCHAGIKQSRGWTWIDVALLVGGEDHNPCTDFPPGFCPLCDNPKQLGKAGLLWIGEKFYPTPAHFDAEGAELGFSRRISAIPRDFKVGETWVLLAHPKAIGRIERDSDEVLRDKYTPGIFKVWRPTKIEQIFVESDRGSDAVKEAEARGITPVFVPDNDKDHQGSVHDKEEEEADAITQ